jgi:2-polyprenyl-6-methoxyphenol hydroxylase-like FAD-dependent oxidoreductase
MADTKEILISGAGPSGLCSALFLSELGYRPRIIDKKTMISPYSKALGVNPRSMAILEKYGVAQRFLDNGRKMPAMTAWRGEKLIFRNEFSKAGGQYPFLLIQPQKESEEILCDELRKRNIHVEYGVQLNSFEQKDGKYFSSLSGTKNETHVSDYLIAADGGHSAIRKQLNVNFEGFRYEESWELYDIGLETSLPPDDAHIRVFPQGGMIMIRVRDNVWRVAGNLKDLLNYLPRNSKTGAVNWKSDFFVSHHLAGKLVHDKIVLIGDAAHLHSPIGGRGMNLGIEDAFITSKLIHEGTLAAYENRRRPYLEKTVNRIAQITQMMAANSGFMKFLKGKVMLAKPFIPLVKTGMRNFALGLDKHEM